MLSAATSPREAVGEISVTPALASARVTLTPAEFRVLELLLRGLANKEIASELGRAERTVKNHVAALFRKFHVHSRLRLMVMLAESNRH